MSAFPAERTAILTGAASPRGIGRATAHYLAERGWSIGIIDLDEAAAQGVDGFVRSLAKELRAGAAGNAVLLDGGASITSASSLAAVRFFLSNKSAFVAGQLLTVGSHADDGASNLASMTPTVQRPRCVRTHSRCRAHW